MCAWKVSLRSRYQYERSETFLFRFGNGFWLPRHRIDRYILKVYLRVAGVSGLVSTIAVFLCISIPLHAQPDSTMIDSVLLQQIQEQMAATNESAALQSSSRSTISTNPNLSVIGDFRLSYDRPASRHFDAEMHETEIAFQSVVDPYARADFYLSLSRDEESGKFGLGLEEAILTSMALPAGLQLKVGKFRSTFGKTNPIHPHALPFIEAPTVNRNFLSDDGLNDEGVALSWLIPNPLDFYQELTFEVTRMMADSRSFAPTSGDRFLYLGHLKNFWDLTENATLEFGVSAMTGPNDARYASLIGGVDLTYKWKPLQYNTYQSLVVQSEVLTSNKKISHGENIHAWGGYILSTWQVGQRYFLTGRFDYSNVPDDATRIDRALSLTLGWYATEFQKIELEGRHSSTNGFADANQVLLRSIFVIGAHGAHSY